MSHQNIKNSVEEEISILLQKSVDEMEKLEHQLICKKEFCGCIMARFFTHLISFYEQRNN